MHNPQTNPEASQEVPAPRPVTLEDFLENDFEGYEYVKGELVSMAPSVNGTSF